MKLSVNYTSDTACVVCGRYLPEGAGLICPICINQENAIQKDGTVPTVEVQIIKRGEAR